MKNSRFQPRRKKTGGRKAGTPNKVPSLLKDCILEAAQRAGNRLADDDEQKQGVVKYLEIQALENPTGFMTLLGKILPMQITESNRGSEAAITLITSEMTVQEAADAYAKTRKNGR